MKLEKNKKGRLSLVLTEETEFDKDVINKLFNEWKSFKGDSKDFTLKLD